MNLLNYCGPLQFYIFISVFAVILQFYHTYSKQSWSWVNKNKIIIFLSLIVSIITFLFFAKVIETLCKSNKTLAWIYVLFPLFIVGIIIVLLTGGFILDKTYSGVKNLL